MIKGLAITPPVLGRISIGRIVEKKGVRLPEKDDQFTLTSLMQSSEGWIKHPLDEELRKQNPNGKLREIPVTMLFNEPDLNFRAEYTLFDRTNGRPICAGDGVTCRRHTGEGMATLPCPSPNLCALGAGGKCKPYGRLNVNIGEDDSLGTFIFRTTGFNSIRTLMARLAYFEAVSGGLLACMPLELKLRGKSTTQSHRAPIYYVDIGIREGITLEEAITQAKTTDGQRKAAGYNQHALDEAARLGFANAEFEEDDEEVPAILEEFYSDTPTDNPTHNLTDTVETSSPTTAANSPDQQKPGLAAKLQRKATSPRNSGHQPQESPAASDAAN